MFKYEIYPPAAKAKTLVIFLHGYNDCAANHADAVLWLRRYLKNACLIVPESQEICDRNPTRRQWFGMLKNDPNNLRSRAETPVAQIFSIYRKAESEIDRRAAEINVFIDSLQQQYGFDNRHTYLLGFSQGAMLTLYTALSRGKPLGGAFVLSGLVAGRRLLAAKIKSHPPLYLFHGKDDLKVQYKTLAATKRWLLRRQIKPTVFTYSGLAHHIIEDEIKEISAVINRR